jgi:GNAT superfamily N-acetyltransferase
MAELRPYEPTWRDRLASALLGDGRSSGRQQFVEGLLGSRGLGQTGMGLVDLTPAGVPLAVQESRQAFEQGSPVSGLLGAMAVLPAAKPVALAARGAFNILRNPAVPATYIHPDSLMYSYVEPVSQSYMNVVTRPGGPRSVSVTDLYVPEEYRRQGIAKLLQSQVMQDFPSLQGQVSSKAAAKNAYSAGRRMAGNESATLEDIFKKIDEDSSVNLWTVK